MTLRSLSLLLPLVPLFTHCGGGGTSTRMPQVINVSAYDPKERQREGQSYSEHDVSALKKNGASALIARCGKGGVLDEKCATFLASADREGMHVGAYYRLQTHVDAVAQADQFVSRMQSIASGRSWNADKILLAGDFDANSRLSDITRFVDRIEVRTGSPPVVYLENSEHMRVMLSQADSATKAKLRRCPYWAALYSCESGACKSFPAPETPKGLVSQYAVWHDWSLWQYAGVDWEKSRSNPKCYTHPTFRSGPYFGNLDRPVERNVFNGSHGELASFWGNHGISTH
ncbi:MAG: GH25 family lysozyme [Verrucomicrobiales bacterium]